MSKKSRHGLLLGLGSILILGVWIFRDPLRSRIGQSAAFANPTLPPELVEEVIEKSPDQPAAILAAWNTGKIVHRQAAMREIAHVLSANQTLPSEIESVVLTGGLDVDMNVRETALGILQDHNHSALPSLAAAQLHDFDPQVRLLGLNYLRRVSAGIGVPVVMPLLEQDDPLIVALALNLLENWSGQKFGVKLRDTTSSENPITGLMEFPEGSHEKARAGASRAKAWWVAHESEFPPTQLEVPREAITGRKPVPAADFSLRDLDGRKVRLSELRGKVVLINFWTTWCTACLSEMPELIGLQKQHADQLAIVGVSLDFVPDSHGHVRANTAAVEEQVGHADKDADEIKSAALQKVRDKVARTVKARGINYTILLDEKNEVGGRFNGGELPTNIIVDRDGNVRRRFVGARSLAVFEAMIKEAAQPERFNFVRPLQSKQ
jgi:thiol-disulfide isomerase/thioredoxin